MAKKIVLITGATRGLGRAMVDELVRHGHTVLGCGRSQEGVERLRRRFGPPHDFAVVNVAADGEVRAWADRLLSSHGPPDLVLNRPQVNGTLVIVSGRTEPGATVTVNGEAADLDASGSFKKVISMTREGINTVVVRAVDGAGNETVRRENVVIEIF